MLTATAFAQQPIAEISILREMKPEQAALQLPVLVEGQVLWVHPTGNGLFLYQNGEGIYVHKTGAAGALAEFTVGDVVQVRGKTDRGLFSASISADHIEPVGKEPLPEARPFFAFELYSAQIDCDWVWVAGRILSKQIQFEGGPGKSITLEVMVNSIPMVVQLPWSEESEQKIDELMFSRVKFTAIAGTQFNLHRQVVGRTFFVSSAAVFELIDDYRPRGGVSVTPIHELLRSGDAHHRLAKATRGIVTYVQGQYMYLRGEEACIKVAMRSGAEVIVGDEVEVEGVVLPQPISPDFAAREVRLIKRTELPPQPVRMTLNEDLRNLWDFHPDSHFNYELVELEAELIDISESFGLTTGHKEKTLLCRQGGYLFEAKVPHDVHLGEELKPGAVFRVQGICNLTRSQERPWRLYVDWFWIQVRSGDDLLLLKAAPWWTAARLLWVLGIGLGLLVAISFWVILLRRTVEKQTGIIADQVERETISEERQRIARELHDNLEQGLAGMAIQLRGAQRVLELNREKRLASIHTSIEQFGDKNRALKDHLEKAEQEVVEDARRNQHAIEVVQGMLTHCSHESRTSIMDLRGGILERLDLVDALKETLQPLAQACGAELKIRVEGEIRKLNQAAERNLLLIIKEAVSNASKHAEPDEMDVLLKYTGSGLSLRIMDNGLGFDTSSVPKVGHFGLQGMRERVNQLKGSIEIKSRPGAGTCVNISITSTAEWELA
ncbi:sensor histidine kinase [Pontiellaceae bacterium B12227]|nr:sensor histidine kinase [Pontiellaceae bacterium B12227]